jgi:hypothetical protein
MPTAAATPISTAVVSPGPAGRLGRAVRLAALALALAAPATLPTLACAQPLPPSTASTAFTYQGVLTDGALPRTTAITVGFQLFDAPSAGNPVGSGLFRNVAPDAQGRFTTTLDFGPDALAGAPRWVELTLFRPFQPPVALSPRQPITAAPIAAFASRAASIAAVSSTVSESADQVASGSGGALGGGLSGLAWQTFTVGTPGLLTRIDLQTFGSSGAGTLRVYQGAGVGGTLLAESTVTFASGGDLLSPRRQSFSISGLRVAPGDVLTWQLLGSINNIAITNGYAGGAANPAALGSNGAFVFTTYVTPLAPLTLNGSPVIVPERLHVAAGSAPGGGAPASAPPAIALTSQGRIGINTASPQAAIDITGTPGTDGVRFPDGSVQTTAFRGLRLAYTSPTAQVIGPGVSSVNIALPGALPGDSVFVTPRVILPGNLSIGSVSVASPGLVVVQLRNPSVVPVNIPPGGLGLDLLAIR